MHSTTCYIDHSQRDPKHRVHRGKSRQKQQEASSGSKLGVHLQHVPLLITTVLMLNYLAVGSALIEQFRGAPMGSPCSPALCNFVVRNSAGTTPAFTSAIRNLFCNKIRGQQSPVTSQTLSCTSAFPATHRCIVLQATGSA